MVSYCQPKEFKRMSSRQHGRDKPDIIDEIRCEHIQQTTRLFSRARAQDVLGAGLQWIVINAAIALSAIEAETVRITISPICRDKTGDGNFGYLGRHPPQTVLPAMLGREPLKCFKLLFRQEPVRRNAELLFWRYIDGFRQRAVPAHGQRLEEVS